MRDGNGNVIRRDFTQKYTVVGPSATVSADLMNVLYAGYDNPISISIPGVPLSNVSASMAGGSFRSVGMGRYIARPAAVGKDVTINVMSAADGRSRQMGKFTFHVRKLPDPTPFIAWRDAQGNIQEYKGGKPFAKGTLLAARGLDAAIDDDLLKIDYRVVSFEMVLFDQMGNAMSERSAGANFSDRQRAAMRNMKHGKRFYISRVRATGPDGVTRDISPMEVIVN